MKTKELKVERIEIEVQYPLSEVAQNHWAVRIGEVMKIRDEMVAVEKARRKAAKKEIDDIEEQLSALGAQIRTKTFPTKVEAERRPILDTGMWQTVRIDSEAYGLIVDEQPMTADERQMTMDLDAEPVPREPVKTVRVPKKASPPSEAH